MASPKKRRETLPPPSVQLSRTASEQVVKISAEIEQLPEDQRRSAWKNQMRMYHPDKKSVFPNLSEEQMNEAGSQNSHISDHISYYLDLFGCLFVF